MVFGLGCGIWGPQAPWRPARPSFLPPPRLYIYSLWFLTGTSLPASKLQRLSQKHSKSRTPPTSSCLVELLHILESPCSNAQSSLWPSPSRAQLRAGLLVREQMVLIPSPFWAKAWDPAGGAPRAQLTVLQALEALPPLGLGHEVRVPHGLVDEVLLPLGG